MSSSNDGFSRRNFLKAGIAAGLTAMAPGAFAARPQELAGRRASCAFIAGESGFFDDSNLPEEQRVNSNLDDRLAIASLMKTAAIVYGLDQIESGVISADEPVFVSPFAKMRSSNSAFPNVPENSFIIVDGKETETVPFIELLRGAASFSFNDFMFAACERMATGRVISDVHSYNESARQENIFARDILTPFAHKLGMTNSHFYTATGLPEKGQLDYSTPRDLKILVDYLVQKHEKYLDLFSEPEILVERRYKKSGQWASDFKRGANDLPLLENSAELEDKKRQPIPTEGVFAGKTGFHDISRWQSLNIKKIFDGRETKYLVIGSFGNYNHDYASEPRRIHDNAMAIYDARPKPIPSVFCPLHG